MTDAPFPAPSDSSRFSVPQTPVPHPRLSFTAHERRGGSRRRNCFR